MATLDSNLTTLCPSLDADAVKEIIDTDLTDARINAFLNMAYYLSRPISNNLGECGGGSAECEIIKLLAAHFITILERQVKSESIAGEWSVTYLGKEGMGLEASLYGQQAVAMDCSGELAKASLKNASFSVTSYRDIDELQWSNIEDDD
jgi:hypothetical protein